MGWVWTTSGSKQVNILVVGSPDTVIRKLTTTLEYLSPGYLLVYGHDGDMPSKDVMRSIELMGKEVIPALHEIQLQPYD